MDQAQVDELLKNLESKGEAQVRKELAMNIYGAWKKPIIMNWLDNKEKEAQNKLLIEQNALEERRHKEMLKEQKRANFISWIGAIVSIIGALISFYYSK